MSKGFVGEEEKVLQAVVLADSFNTRFMPLSLDRPRCLMPLVGVPLLEYTFEFLVVSGVQETVLYCRAHADQIRQYLASSRWSKASSPMQVTIVVNPDCCSVGDALRDIDSRALVHGDEFILVQGDLVSNANLCLALEAHRKLRQTVDRNFIMTMVLAEASPFHRTRERCESGLFLIDNRVGACLDVDSLGECISYEMIDSERDNARGTLPLTRLQSASELQLRFDLLDCNVDICSTSVLALCTENFDYDDIRRDFVPGVLTSDIFGVRIATYVLPPGQYAARVRSPHHYDAVSRDLLSRWVFPIVPECSLGSLASFASSEESTASSATEYEKRSVSATSAVSRGSGSLRRNSANAAGSNATGNQELSTLSAAGSDESFSSPMMDFGRKMASATLTLARSNAFLGDRGVHYRMGHCYIGRDVVLSRSANIKQRVYLGCGTHVGDGSVIRDSVIGLNCHVGCNVDISGSYLWDNVKIEDGCRLRNCIIADGVHVLARTVIEDGVLIAGDVTLGGPGVVVPARCRVAKLGEHDDDVELASTLAASSQRVLGDQSDGILWSELSDGRYSEQVMAGSLVNSTAEYGAEENQTESEYALKEGAFEIGGSFHCSRPRFMDQVSSSDEDDADQRHVLSGGAAVGAGGGGLLSADSVLESHAEVSLDEEDDAGFMENQAFGRNLAKFHEDALDQVRHAIDNEYDPENALLELNGLKFSCNATFADCRLVVVRVLLDVVMAKVSTGGMSQSQAVERVFMQWSTLLDRFTRGEDEQYELIDNVETVCREEDGFNRLFQYVVPVLYKTDVLDEDAVFVWFQNHEQSNSLYVRQIRGFVDWLSNESSSDEEDDDDDDEEDDE